MTAERLLKEFDRINEMITDTSPDIASIYYLGYLHGLTYAINDPAYDNEAEDMAEYLIQQVGAYFYRLENVKELKPFFK